MDHILATMSVPATNIRLVSEGHHTPLPSATSGSAGQAAEAIYDQYRKGATISMLYLRGRTIPVVTVAVIARGRDQNPAAHRPRGQRSPGTAQ